MPMSSAVPSVLSSASESVLPVMYRVPVIAASLRSSGRRFPIDERCRPVAQDSLGVAADLADDVGGGSNSLDEARRLSVEEWLSGLAVRRARAQFRFAIAPLVGERIPTNTLADARGPRHAGHDVVGAREH